MGDKMFETKDEEIKYWRIKAEEFKQSLEESREELEEFQISSRELELELETQLSQSEKRNKELISANEKFKFELENLRERVEKDQEHLNRQITQLQEDYTRSKQDKEDLQRYIRQLEQVNDDLERAKRTTVVSLEDFEGKLNQAIERNAFLESELDEKEALLVTVQRLKDEARDLRQEVDVRKVTHDGPDEGIKRIRRDSVPVEHSAAQTDHIDSNRLSEPPVASATGGSTTFFTPMSPFPPPGAAICTSSGLSPMSPGFRQASYLPVNGTNPLTPSVRISALNLVGDLLRKVGALESKLNTCRTYSDVGASSTLPNGTSRRPNGLQTSGSLVSQGSGSPRVKQTLCDPPAQAIH